MQLKLKKDQARAIMVAYLQHRYPHLSLPCPVNLKCIMENGRNTVLPVLVNEENKTVTLLNDTALTSYMVQVAKFLWDKGDQIGKFMDVGAFNMSMSSINDAKNVWLHSEDSFLKESVKSFAFKSDPGYAFSRCEFDPCDVWQPTPTFDALMGNFSNSDAIMAFLGSLFFADSYMQQYVWIYGGGGNGKGALIRAIQRVFGHAFHSSSYVPEKEDKHWTYELIGKRFVVFPDCNSYGFVKSGLFKSLTGGDSIRVEQKFKDVFHVRLDAKYMFHSNDLPKIENDQSDLRRIILSEALNEEAFKPDPNFEKMLATETPAFISNCILKYKQLCPNHEQIPCDTSSAQALALNNEEVVHAWIEKHFEIGDGYMTTAADFHEIVRRFGTHLYKNQLFKILKRDYGCESKNARYENKVRKVYARLKLVPNQF